MKHSANQWIIFDGDNTLWHVEELYDKARKEMCALLADFGIDLDDADEFQRARDAQLFNSMGYSKKRFPQSFEDTLRHFVPGASPITLACARGAAEAVFSSLARPVDDVDAILAHLGSSYKLALLTAGEQQVQELRLAAFGRSHCFEVIRIVEKKTSVMLAAFAKEHGMPIASTWMIGDSLRSDIVPATEVGMKAVLVETPNWHPVETGRLKLPIGILSARSLAEAAALLQKFESKAGIEPTYFGK